MAVKTKDPDQRKMLEDMAAAWEGLASERGKFLKINPAGILLPADDWRFGFSASGFFFATRFSASSNSRSSSLAPAFRAASMKRV